MKVFRWYNLVCIMLLSFLLKQTTTEDGKIAIEDIYKAVIASYDVSLSFEENMDIIMHYICPQHPAPSCAVGQEIETRLPILSNKSSDANNIAREFIKNNAHNLPGCCGKCSCENTCFINENCCFLQLSNNELGNSYLKQPKSRCVAANIKAYMAINKAKIYPNMYFMVSTCLAETVDTDVVNRCLEPNINVPDEVIPVVSYTTKVIYLNRFCAQCNHENNTAQWVIKIIFPSQLFMSVNERLTDSISEIIQIGMTRLADIEFIPPAYFNSSYDDFGCVPDTGMAHCDSTGAQTVLSGNELVDRACSSVKVPFITFSVATNYLNVFCYLCNNRQQFAFRQKKECQAKSRKSGNNLSGLINLRDTEKGINVEADNKNLLQRGNNCTCQEMLDQKQEQCRKVYCPYMEQYVGCLCIRFIDHLYGLKVNVFFELRPYPNGVLPKKWKERNNAAITKLKSAVNKQFRQIGTLDIEHYAVFENSDRLGYFFYFVSSISPKYGFDSLVVLSDIYTRLRNGISVSFDGTVYKTSIGKLFELNLDLSSKFALSENENMFTTKQLFSVNDKNLYLTFSETQTLSQLLFCKQILLTGEETEVFTNSTDLTKFRNTGKIGDVFFWQFSDDVKICLEDYVELFRESTNNGNSFHNMWKVFLLLSVIFFA